MRSAPLARLPREKPRVLVIQPYLTAYRIPVFAQLGAWADVFIASSPPDGSAGYGAVTPPNGTIQRHYYLREGRFAAGRLLWQRGWLKVLREVRPDKILCAANPRSLSFWCIALLSHIAGVEFYAHGQGAYNKQQISFPLRFIYRAIVGLSTRYLCYTDSVRRSLENIVNERKLVVVENSLELDAALPFRDRTHNAPAVLFLGRLREECGLDILVDALTLAGGEQKIELHVIGGGAMANEFRKRYAEFDWIHWYGAVYDDQTIREIARRCTVGCYPGNAGLSVVHYMALSLVPVVHDRMDLHMGPEPSYIKSGENGLLYAQAGGSTALREALQNLLASPSERAAMARKAYATYESLTRPPLSARIANAMALR